MSVALNNFILSELNKAKAKALTSGQYGLLSKQIHMLANYVNESEQLLKLNKPTVKYMLEAALLAHEKGYVNFIKRRAFSLYRENHNEEPKSNIENKLEKRAIRFYNTIGNQLKALKIEYWYELENGNTIVQEALDQNNNYLKDTFNLLSERVKHSDTFTIKMYNAVSDWAKTHLYKPSKWKQMSTVEKLDYLSMIQVSLQETFDPTGFLKVCENNYLVEIQKKSIRLENAKKLRISKQGFDESTLEIHAGYSNIFGQIIFSGSSLTLYGKDDSYVDSINSMIRNIKSKLKKKCISITINKEQKKIKIECSHLNNYRETIKTLVHETVHQFQQQAYFAFITDPDKAKKLTGFTKDDAFIEKLSTNSHIDGSKAESDTEIYGYLNNPGEIQAKVIEKLFDKNFL